jgi:uncharacterized protein (DUF2252 family)
MTTEASGVGPARVARGKSARAATPLASHAEFTPARGRDPVGLLLEQAKTREPDLVPVRHGRMLVSPFTYFRGAALPMAADLADTPVSGLRAQLCGDAHLANFGAFASPERRLMFDINDFDETLPGPFEWDVKRLAASFAVAGRQNNLSRKERRGIIRAAANTYRMAMRGFAQQSATDVWYAHLDMDDAVARYRAQIPAKARRMVEKLLTEARGRDSRQALRRLTTMVDGHPRIASNPPTIVPIEELFSGVQSEAIYDLVGAVLRRYRRSLQSDRRHLLEQFELVQVVRKVVGVGSVGQRAWAVLLASDDGREPLLLQAKDAQPSILSDHCGRTRYHNEGERVVAGQRLMQAASDIFLGWTGNLGAGGERRDFYVRQLRDWKLSFPIEQMGPPGLTIYAYMCGWTLARAHARSGDRHAIAAYLGRGDTFDRAIADFGEAYADQNERDYADFRAAVDHGRATAAPGV